MRMVMRRVSSEAKTAASAKMISWYNRKNLSDYKLEACSRHKKTENERYPRQLSCRFRTLSRKIQALLLHIIYVIGQEEENDDTRFHYSTSPTTKGRQSDNIDTVPDYLPLRLPSVPFRSLYG